MLSKCDGVCLLFFKLIFPNINMSYLVYMEVPVEMEIKTKTELRILCSSEGDNAYCSIFDSLVYALKEG